jgi:hypothetical protein
MFCVLTATNDDDNDDDDDDDEVDDYDVGITKFYP